MKKKKCIRLLSMILIVAMMCTAMSMTVLAEPRVSANKREVEPEVVEYYDENGFVAEKACTSIFEAPTNDDDEIVLTNGWYVLDNTSFCEISKRIRIQGDVKLVFQNADGCNLQGGIHVPSKSSLSFYCAVGERYEENPGNITIVMINQDAYPGCAGIGGDANECNGKISIYGGNINISVNLSGPCIGKGVGAVEGACGTVHVYSGMIYASYSTYDIVDLGTGKIWTHEDGLIEDSSSGKKISPCNNHEDSDNDTLCDHCNAPMNCEVSFETNGGDDVDLQNVEYNSTATEPSKPEREKSNFLYWTYNGERYDFRNKVRSDIELVAQWEDTYYAEAVSATVIYEGGLKLRFTIHLSDDLKADSDAVITFTKRGEELKTVPLSEKDGESASGDYMFVVPVPAAEWMDEIGVTITDDPESENPYSVPFRDTDGQAYPNNVLTYSIYEHCMNCITNPDAYSSRYYGFVKNGVYDYCRAAQMKFDYHVEELEDPSYVSDINPDSAYKKTSSGIKPAGLNSVSLNVNFLDNNTLRVIFTLDTNSSNGYEFTLLDSENNLVTNEAKHIGKNRFALDAENISAANLTKPFKYTISDGTNTYTVTASVMSYAIMAMRSNDPAMANLGRALYKYGLHADEYFNSQT